MNLKVYRIVNVIVWSILAILMMFMAYKVWSMHGEYTLLSFIASLIIHGGCCAMICWGIDCFLKKLFK